MSIINAIKENITSIAGNINIEKLEKAQRKGRILFENLKEANEKTKKMNLKNDVKELESFTSQLKESKERFFEIENKIEIEKLKMNSLKEKHQRALETQQTLETQIKAANPNHASTRIIVDKLIDAEITTEGIERKLQNQELTFQQLNVELEDLRETINLLNKEKRKAKSVVEKGLSRGLSKVQDINLDEVLLNLVDEIQDYYDEFSEKILSKDQDVQIEKANGKLQCTYEKKYAVSLIEKQNTIYLGIKINNETKILAKGTSLNELEWKEDSDKYKTETLEALERMYKDLRQLKFTYSVFH